MGIKQEATELLIRSFNETFESYRESIREEASNGNHTCIIRVTPDRLHDDAFWYALKASDLGELNYSLDSFNNLLEFKIF